MKEMHMYLSCCNMYFSGCRVSTLEIFESWHSPWQLALSVPARWTKRSLPISAILWFYNSRWYLCFSAVETSIRVEKYVLNILQASVEKNLSCFCFKSGQTEELCCALSSSHNRPWQMHSGSGNRTSLKKHFSGLIFHPQKIQRLLMLEMVSLHLPW